MRTFSFRRGTRIRIERDVFRLVSKFEVGDEETWQLERLSDHLLVNQTTTDLHNLYLDEKLHLDTDDEDGTPLERMHRRRRQKTVLGDLPDAKKAEVAAMRRIIREVDNRVAMGMRDKKPEGQSLTYLQIALREICQELGLKKSISRATYFRIVAKFKEHNDTNDLIPKYSLRGNRNQLDPEVRQWMLDALGQLLVGGLGKTLISARAKVKAQVDEANALNLTHSRRLVLPSRKTFSSYWKQAPAIDRAKLKYGPTRARHMFRSVRGHEGPEACLDLVEFDETELPFFVIDEIHGVPLGSPHFAWTLDVNSQVPTGLYLGFEPPSDVALTSTIRHALLPKSYMRDLFPDIRNPWSAGGRFHLLSIDNSLSQHGRTLEDIALSVDFDIKYTPVRTPWFKPIVERSFGIANQLLLEDLPGYKPPPGTILDGYNPAKQGLIGFNRLLFILHKWIADSYLLRPHGELGRRPLDLWIEGTRDYPPEFLGSKTNLEALFGIVREGTLDHRGVVFERLRYHSDELEGLLAQHGELRRHGARMDVRVKINFDNLGSVRVYDPVERVWIRAVALRRDYAEGLSLHRHLLYKKHAMSRKLGDDPDAWLIAHHEIQEFVRHALPLNLGIGVNKAIARALGIGSHSLMGEIGLDGNLIARDPATESFSLTREFSASTAPPNPTLPPPAVAAPSAPTVVPAPIRRIPKFKTDGSLGRG